MWLSEKRVSKIVDDIIQEVNKAAEDDLDQLAESTAIQLAEAMNTQGFRIIGGNVGEHGFSASDTDTREKAVTRTRAAYFSKSLGYSPIRHSTEFALGDGGIKCPTVQLPQGNDSTVDQQQEYLEEFWNDKINQKIFTSSVAQYQVSDKLQYDGELFVALFGNSDPTIRQPITDVVSIRLFDTFDIRDPIVTDPYDSATELAYWKRHHKIEFNLDSPGVNRNEGNSVLYASTTLAQRYGQFPHDRKAFVNGIVKRVQRGVWVYHQTFGSDPLENRGWPATARIVAWLEKHDTVFRDAMQFLRSLLQFAWKRKVKPGTKSQMARERAFITKVYRQLATKAVAGSSLMESQNVENAPIHTPTGGIQIASDLGKRIELMIGAGTGLPHNYLTGDISQGTLATAKSMELPVIKHARMWQAQLRALYEGVCQFVLWTRFKEKAGMCQASFPPMIEDDIPPMVTAVTNAATVGVLPFEDDPDTGEAGATTIVRNVLGRRV